MKSVRPLVFLLAFMFSAIATLHFTASSVVPPPPQEQESVVAGDPLTEAIKSGVTIRFGHLNLSGSGVLIGRTKLANGNWRYQLLTAYHVMEDVRDALKEKPDEADKIKKLTIVYQNGFHAPLRIIQTSLSEIEWAIPGQDWGIFSFESPQKLPCAELATKKEFESIQPYDHIYGVGSDGGDGLFFREGVIASTNGTQPFASLFGRQYAWDFNQECFFRAYHGIYYGASGGPVFNRQGKIIGIYNGFVQLQEGQPITNLAVVLKAHLVRQMLERTNSDITRIDN